MGKPKTVHFDADGKGYYFPGAAECGADRNSYGTSNLRKTKDPRKVTCKRCRKQFVWHEAMAEQYAKEANP